MENRRKLQLGLDTLQTVIDREEASSRSLNTRSTFRVEGWLTAPDEDRLAELCRRIPVDVAIPVIGIVGIWRTATNDFGNLAKPTLFPSTPLAGACLGTNVAYAESIEVKAARQNELSQELVKHDGCLEGRHGLSLALGEEFAGQIGIDCSLEGVEATELVDVRLRDVLGHQSTKLSLVQPQGINEGPDLLGLASELELVDIVHEGLAGHDGKVEALRGLYDHLGVALLLLVERRERSV